MERWPRTLSFPGFCRLLMSRSAIAGLKVSFSPVSTTHMAPWPNALWFRGLFQLFINQPAAALKLARLYALEQNNGNASVNLLLVTDSSSAFATTTYYCHFGETSVSGLEEM